VGVLRRRWLQVLVSGLVLLFFVERTLVATSNPNYVPSVILLGAFLVPISFVTYLYERLPSWDVPLQTLAMCFMWGGVLGTVVAGTLEYDVARALGFLPKLLIGLIEESAKLILPLIFYFVGRYRSEAAGIVLGVATAAGFAGLETMGYGFASLLSSKGNLGVLDEVLLVRGLTSPAGHMAWTGLVCAVLWRETQGGARDPRLASSRGFLDGGGAARFVGHLREPQERYLRGVLECGAREPTYRADQSHAIDPEGTRGPAGRRR
jgi:RsiW-degrading membrane proteinase PrsW (M82 family)